MDNSISDKNKDNQTILFPWFKEGLKFECQRCGRCCRGEPGVIWVNKKEIEKYHHFWVLRRTHLPDTI